MKSSRRKQTNPNRVSSGTLDPENRLPPPGALPESDSKLVEDNSPSQIPLDCHENENSRNDSPSFPERPRANNSFDLPMDLHVSSSYSNAEDLQDHKNDAHGQQPAKKMRVDEDAPDDFPTAYHRLGRELSETTDLPMPNGHLKSSESESASPPTQASPPSLNHTPFPSQPRTPPTYHPSRDSGSPNLPSDMSMYSSKNIPDAITGELPSSGKSERIFHMDAYCGLCDREFCNKYFLKTHKANKHGIYEDSSPPIGSVPLPMPGLIGPGGQEPQQSPFNFKIEPAAMKHQSSIEEPLLPWSFKLDPPSPISSKKQQDQPQPSHKPMESPLPMFHVPLPNVENSKYPGQIRVGNPQTSSPPNASGSSSTSMLSSITNSIKAAPPLNDPSMEDYCHICQKHFCNKYYLKKHKQDVHGIAPETPINSSNKRPRSSLLDSMPMNSSANPMIMSQGMPGLASMPNIPGMHNIPGMPNLPGMPNMPPGVMVLNPYHLPPVAIIPAGSLMPGQQIPPHHPIISQPLSMPSMSMSESSLPPNSSMALSSSSASTFSSSHQRQSPPSGNKPQGISQDDAAVHCNICGKEFCNEFYLHVHKESKHKIPKEELLSPRDKALSLVKDKRPSESNKSSPPPLSSTNQSSDAVNVPPMSPLNHGTRPDSGKLACNMCNKDFNDFYSLHTHRIHEHGFPDMSDGMRGPPGEFLDKDDAIRNMNRSLARMAADASAVSNASGFGHKPDKSQESAICDICNKEMTNQYFLRIHRFNVHGIDPSSNEKFERKPLSSPMPPSPISKTPPSSNNLPLSSPSQQPLNLVSINPIKPSMLPFLPPKIDFKDMPPFADFGRDFKGLRDMPPFLTDSFNNELFARSQNRRHLDLNFFGFPSMGKMPGEDNVKLNFDPEAYCDICKKEFCSKYFLRTHKQNIHGIKCDVSSNSPYPSKMNEMDKLTTTTSVMNGSVKPKIDLNEKSSWKWKEPVNSSRVVCDICNKEVCNKYFLRTHKFKKHGIPPTSQSPNMSLNGSPVASDCDTASNTSSQPDEKPFRMDSILNMPQMIPLPPSDRLGDKFQNKNMNNMKGRDINQNNNGECFETCNLCRKRFRNAKMLKEHIWKHHSVNDGMDPRAKNSPPIYPCQVCGIDFPAELSVQLHLIQEHNARVTLDTEEPQIPMEEPGLPNEEGGKACNFYGRNWGLRKSHQRIKKFFCARCDFSTVWLSSLMEHEKTDHSVTAFEASGFKCKHCQQMESSLMSLSKHLETAHGKTHEVMCEELKDVKFEPFTSYKCSHCPAVFPSHARAVAHFREIHIRSRHDLNLKRSFRRSTLHCMTCSFKTHFLSRLRRHAKSKSHKIYIPRTTPVSPTATMIETERNSSTPSPTTSSSSTDNTNFHASTPTSIHLSAQDPSDSHDDDGLSRGVPSYKTITASMLSPPDCGGEHHRNVNLGDVPPRRDDIVLQTYSLPMSPVVMDTPASFKLSSQPSGTSAVVGL